MYVCMTVDGWGGEQIVQGKLGQLFLVKVIFDKNVYMKYGEATPYNLVIWITCVHFCWIK